MCGDLHISLGSLICVKDAKSAAALRRSERELLGLALGLLLNVLNLLFGKIKTSAAISPLKGLNELVDFCYILSHVVRQRVVFR